MNIPSWVYAVAVAVPLSVGGTYAAHKVYIDNVTVEVDEEELAEKIVNKQAIELDKRMAEQKVKDDEYFCNQMRGWKAFEDTGACK